MNKLSKLTKTIIPALAAFLFLTLLPTPAKSQNVIPLVVAPARQQLNIDPGTSQRTNIKFLNQSDTPLSGNLKAVDFIVTDSQGSPILIDENSPLSTRFSAASWITLSFDKATIAPNQQLNVPIVINSPKDARPGGRYVAVYFEPTGTLPSLNSTTGTLLATSSRVVGLVYIRVNGDITENAFVVDFKVPRFIEFGPAPISFKITNKGDYHITPKGQLTLFNLFNKKVASYELEEKNIFPDASYLYKTELGKKIMVGKYKLSLVSLYGESNKVMTYNSSFWAFPIRLVIIIILAIAIIILIVVNITKRLKGRQNKLESKLEEEIAELESLKNKFKDTLPKK